MRWQAAVTARPSPRGTCSLGQVALSLTLPPSLPGTLTFRTRHAHCLALHGVVGYHDVPHARHADKAGAAGLAEDLQVSPVGVRVCGGGGDLCFVWVPERAEALSEEVESGWLGTPRHVPHPQQDRM